MLFEFSEQLANVQDLIDQELAIADNSGVDDIDLSVLDVDPEELASACFSNSGASTAPQTIALREAHEFVVSHRRIQPVLAYTREYYYEQAVEDYDVLKQQNDHLDAVLQRLEQIGAPK